MTTAIAPALSGHPAGLVPRVAKKSDDYVAEILRRRGSDPNAGLSTEAKMRKIALVLRDEQNGIRRIGTGMIGMIQLKLRYQGIVRNVLIEDPITPGTPVEYEVIDDLGQAYTMSGTDGEVRIQAFEGKRIRVDFFRIASRPAVRVEDLVYLRVNIVEQAQDETKQSIMKQEDSRLFSLLLQAEDDYSDRSDHLDEFGGVHNHTITEGAARFQPGTFYDAVSITEEHELVSDRVIGYPTDIRDMYRWGTDDTGWAFKDRVVAGEKITSYGEFQVQRSIVAPKGKLLLLPEPRFLGVLPVLYSLVVEENHKVEDFWKGWVFHEMVNMTILNPRGIAVMDNSA